MGGWRLSHEDAHTLLLEWQPPGALAGAPEAAVLVVLDGHGGAQAAAFCADMLLKCLEAEFSDDNAAAQAMSSAPSSSSPSGLGGGAAAGLALQRAFIRCDEKLKEHLRGGGSGTT